MAHHQGIGLAYVVGIFARGHLDGGNQGAAGGDNAVLGRGGQVGVGTDQLGTVLHHFDRLFDLFIVQGAGLAEHHVIGVHVVHGKSRLVKGIGEAGLADHVDRSAGALCRKEGGGGQRAGIKMILADRKPHAGKLHAKLSW